MFGKNTDGYQRYLMLIPKCAFPLDLIVQREAQADRSADPGSV